MMIKEVLALGVLELEDFQLKQLETRILLASVLNITQETLLARYNEEISQEEKSSFLKYVKRRKEFEPIAYILGKKEFYGIDLFINNNVLIPRPDTEMLVDEVILEYKRSFLDKEVAILELGTGSGAIAVSLATEILLSQIIATDISSDALELAAKNSKLHEVANKIEFIKSDWYLGLMDHKFDFIVSNPPYISFDDKIYMPEETLLYEPKIALFANDNGLINYTKIIAGSNNFLKNGGKIFLEVGFNQAKAVVKILENYGFTEITILKDLSAHDRVIKATRLVSNPT